MRMYDIIKKKRDGGELTRAEIEFFVKGCTDETIPDYQSSAFCMAVYYKGMTERETADLTLAIAHSGECVDLSAFGNKSVDKHSTGGVGDKTTLIVAPIVATLGCIMVKLSGRGLGHTGGTVDKLESIEGYKTSLTPEQMTSQVESIGIAVAGQTGNLAPADKKLYALRDVTATVDSLPLIASSIMSKKLAGGSHNIVLDVKYGSGAFMKTPEKAKELAEAMVKIGKSCGRNTAALITDMDEPLGRNIGNSLEIIEAVEVLRGNGPEDLRVVSVALAAEIVSLSHGISLAEAELLCNGAVDSGDALKKMRDWISGQGGNANWLENTELFPKAAYSYEVRAQKSGHIFKTDSESIGRCSVMLGAGREKKTDSIDLTAGIIMNKKPGDEVEKGELLATLYSSVTESFSEVAEKYLSAVEIRDELPERKALIYDIVR